MLSKRQQGAFIVVICHVNVSGEIYIHILILKYQIFQVGFEGMDDDASKCTLYFRAEINSKL